MCMCEYQRPLARLGYAMQPLSCARITKKQIFTSIKTGFVKEKGESAIFQISDRVNFLTIFMYAKDWQSPEYLPVHKLGQLAAVIAE